MASKSPFSDFLRVASRIAGRAAIDVPNFVRTAFRSTDAVFVNKPGLLIPGKMYLFVYDAKWKEILPYFDQHPLIFPFIVSSDRFIGINFHYLPMGARATLMDALYTLTNDKTIRDETTLNMISYSMLKSFSKFRFFKPCVHMYLNSHVRSRLLNIPATQWNKAILLPTQRFTGPHGQSVHYNKIHHDSRKKY